MSIRAIKEEKRLLKSVTGRINEVMERDCCADWVAKYKVVWWSEAWELNGLVNARALTDILQGLGGCTAIIIERGK